MTMRRTRGDWIAFAFRNVDTKDMEWLAAKMDDSGHGQFWKSVIRELDGALRRTVAGELVNSEKTDAPK